MSALFSHARQFLRREDGPTSVEYAFATSLIIAVVVGVVVTIGHMTSDNFNSAVAASETSGAAQANPLSSMPSLPQLGGQSWSDYISPMAAADAAGNSDLFGYYQNLAMASANLGAGNDEAAQGNYATAQQIAAGHPEWTTQQLNPLGS